MRFAEDGFEATNFQILYNQGMTQIYTVVEPCQLAAVGLENITKSVRGRKRIFKEFSKKSTQMKLNF